MTIPLRTRSLRAGTVLHRVHRRIHDPICFEPGGTTPELRYDDPGGVFQVLYLAREMETAFRETVVRVPTVTDVLSNDVLIRARSEIVTIRTLRLYPLDDAGVSAHGLRIHDILGDNYVGTRKLSAYIHANTSADGIAYISRFKGGRCIALFDRAADAVTKSGVLAVPLTPELGTELAGRFGKDYVES